MKTVVTDVAKFYSITNLVGAFAAPRSLQDLASRLWPIPLSLTHSPPTLISQSLNKVPGKASERYT
jgi:hypothetical protein